MEERTLADGLLLVADAGPVGALVLLLEIDRRGERPLLTPIPAGSDPDFPEGGISARWYTVPPVSSLGSGLPIAELIALARYALL